LPMFATAISLAIMGLVIAAITSMVRQDGAKIVAALNGRSWAAEAKSGRAVIVRFSSAYKAAEPAPAWPAMRAAA
jgi:hypothetical protein